MTETFARHRPLLFGIAYRMLGRVTEAEDLVQETWLRWQKQKAADIQNPRAWLVAAITRLAIDQLRAARREREEYYGVWLPEPLVESPAPGPDESAVMADSLSLAFLVLLETLAPVERAVFLLREVFDYDYAEIAHITGKQEANCRQIARRARERLAAATPVARPPGRRARQLVEQFMAATASGRVQELLALLAGDAVLYTDGGGRVLAAGRPILTADRISRFFASIWKRLPPDTELRWVPLNRRPGLVMLTKAGVFNALAIDLADDRVKTIYLIRNPEKLQHLAGLIPPKTIL